MSLLRLYDSGELMKLMPSAPDFHVSPSVKLLDTAAKDKPMSDGSGPISLDLLASYDRDTSCWKIPQASLPLEMEQPSVKLSEIWPRSGTMRNGRVFPRPALERGINANAYGLLPTPTQSDQINRRPSKQPHKTKNGTWRHLALNGEQSFMRLAQTVKLLLGKHDGHVPPEFFEWMMGMPLNWTNLEPEPVAIPSSGKSLSLSDIASLPASSQDKVA